MHIKKLFTILILMITVFSCKNSLEDEIWIGLYKNNTGYIEFWFDKDELIIYDYSLGYFRTRYLLKNNALIIDQDIFKSDTLMLSSFNCNEIELGINDSLGFNFIKAKIPYHISPFQINLNDEETVEKYFDSFWLEVTRRKDYFFNYLKEGSYYTNY